MTDGFFDKQPIKRRLNQKQFAEVVNKTPAWVCQLVRDGVLLAGPDGFLDEEENLARYDKFSAVPRRDKLKATKEKTEGRPQDIPPKTDDDLFGNRADSELKEKFFKAERAELEFKQLDGQLVAIDDVKIQAFDAARKTRDKLQQMPRRLRGPVVAEMKRLISEQRGPDACPHCGAVLFEGERGALEAHAIEMMISKEVSKVLDELGSSLLMSFGVEINADGPAAP